MYVANGTINSWNNINEKIVNLRWNWPKYGGQFVIISNKVLDIIKLLYYFYQKLKKSIKIINYKWKSKAYIDCNLFEFNINNIIKYYTENKIIINKTKYN